MFAHEEIDGHTPANPNWNKSTDTLDTLNLKLHAEITRGLLAGVSALANQ